MRFRFTIRDLLWLTLVVALAVGWWLDHRRLTPDPFPPNPDLHLILHFGQEVHEKAADLSPEERANLGIERAKDRPERDGAQ